MIYNTSFAPHLRSPNILWQNALLDATVTVSAETATGLGVSCLTQSTNDGWSCPDATGTLTAVFAGATSAAFAAFAAHTLSGRTVQVQAWNGAAWVTKATRIITSNEAFILAFPRATATQWRVVISGGAFSIGVLFLGLSLTIPGVIQLPHTPLHMCEQVNILNGNQSRNGQFLQSEVEILGGRAGLSFEVQTPQFVMAEFEAFRQWFNRGNAFFIACAPEAWPLDMGYCWRDGGEIVPPWRDAVFMDLSMQVGVYRG